MSLPLPAREWTRSNFLISTQHELIQPQAIQAAFDSDFMYWAKPMSDDGLKRMLANSLCFGMYDTSAQNSPQIGFARLITDQVTLAYLTDVYIMPTYQSSGLGKWLVKCVQEHLESWPELRGTLIYCDQEEGPMKFYEEAMGLKKYPQGKDGLVIMTRRFAGSAMSVPGE